jgi:hypothetical protein
VVQVVQGGRRQRSTPGRQAIALTPTLGFTCVAPVCVTDSGYVYCLGASGAAASYFAALSANGLSEWVATTPYPAPPVNNPACVASQGYVYCVGQVYNGPNWYDYVQGVYFAPLSSSGIGSWTQTTALPLENFGGTCVASSGYLYCIYDQFNAYFAPISHRTALVRGQRRSPPPDASVGCFGAGDLVYCVSAGSSAAGAGSSAFQEGPSYFAPMSDSGLGSWTATTALPTPIFFQTSRSQGPKFTIWRFRLLSPRCRPAASARGHPHSIRLDRGGLLRASLMKTTCSA